MKTVFLITAGMLAILTSLLLIPNTAHACSCDAYPDYLSTMTESKIAFQGIVTKVIQNDSREEVYFDVTFRQKGTFDSNQYVIEQSRWSSCAVNYRVGETYQVFAYDNDEIMGPTNMCSTKQITGFTERSHEDENGQIKHYREHYNILTQYNLGTIIIPVSIIIIIISCFVIWRVRKRRLV